MPLLKETRVSPTQLEHDGSCRKPAGQCVAVLECLLWSGKGSRLTHGWVEMLNGSPHRKLHVQVVSCLECLTQEVFQFMNLSVWENTQTRAYIHTIN